MASESVSIEGKKGSGFCFRGHDAGATESPGVHLRFRWRGRSGEHAATQLLCGGFALSPSTRRRGKVSPVKPGSHTTDFIPTQRCPFVAKLHRRWKSSSILRSISSSGILSPLPQNPNGADPLSRIRAVVLLKQPTNSFELTTA